jgi:hypothetical protein
MLIRLADWATGPFRETALGQLRLEPGSSAGGKRASENEEGAIFANLASQTQGVARLARRAISVRPCGACRRRFPPSLLLDWLVLRG